MANEKRLIDANVWKHETCLWCNEHYPDEPCEPSDCPAMAYINDFPTVDAVEVVHGRWEDNHCTVCGMMPMGDELWDQCDFAPPKFEMFMDYCPNCGAKMDGDGNGN